ncbi:hypothetical protein AGABI1DRAFT_105512 [Agaricus bisporus var. burnettii JB137-S8]|uniref:Uncharacterized protein n=1 Tax=Agaricus bisporus var. burnettii (strain JB137-S8 / ATCC MYA-4627 / FGSC 10392) TaxID=597362 RepID=K5XFM1_AGABU|nr:uncharacterized protein AGABI1DRAFT_105512 [Agaricus bisporus var. burnettii JB137-S8]EKM82198.1 hypothetical protein AGABI1DRAFT_105512 [Agaricus bisporus var. burnettii JB137-S8]
MATLKCLLGFSGTVMCSLVYYVIPGSDRSRIRAPRNMKHRLLKPKMGFEVKIWSIRVYYDNTLVTCWVDRPVGNYYINVPNACPTKVGSAPILLPDQHLGHAFILLTFASFTFIISHTPDFRTQHTSPFSNQALEYPTYPIPRDLPPLSTSEGAVTTLPPLYHEYTAYEDALPQHDYSLPSEGSDARFVFFANHAWGAGWGNIMQSMILEAHLAYASGRTFVFDNYTWNREGEYSDFNGRIIPSQIPLSALVAGPIIGLPYTNSTTALTHPRAVSRRYYNHVCPKPYIIHSDEVKNTLTADPSALEMMNVWIEKLKNIEDRCVEIEIDTPQVFDIWLFGSTQLHDIVPTLLNSPIVKDFSWSPLVNHAFRQNQDHFSSHRERSLSQILFPSILSIYNDSAHMASLPPTPSPAQTKALPLLALHLRRGDFIQHCDGLAQWRSTYTGFNTLPSLPDRFFAENNTLLAQLSEQEIKDRYREKCFPDVDAVRRRVVTAVKEWRSIRLEIELAKRWWIPRGWMTNAEETRVKKMLRKVYIMTNGDLEFLQELKEGLYGDAHLSSVTSHSSSVDSGFDYDFVWDWDEVSTSRDLEWGWETKYVAQAMDMYVGQRAELFVGNGFSSLTANVVLMRFAAGVEPWRTRFW